MQNNNKATECVTCGQQFVPVVDALRHADETGHVPAKVVDR